MALPLASPPITAIIPTLGRADMLRLCLASLLRQTVRISEVIVIHCGQDTATAEAARDPRWADLGVRYEPFAVRNAAAQRNHAFRRASHDYLLFLDDDVELDADFVAALLEPMQSDQAVGATMGQAINHPLGRPPLLWRAYRRLCEPGRTAFTPGRLIGAAVPNGFPGEISTPIPVEWLAGGLMLVRRLAFAEAGGFAPYFTGPSPGEDVDFGYRVSRTWKVFYVPAAKAVHHQADIGRAAPGDYHYEWIRGRFATMRRGMGRTHAAALAHVTLWALVQTLSEVAALRKGWRPGLPAIWRGRWRGVLACLFWEPPLAPAASAAGAP